MVAGFLQVGGDTIVVQQVLHSLQQFPPGSKHVTIELADSLVHVFCHCFRMALIIALPLIATVVFANLCVGMISRSLSGIWTAALGGFVPSLLLGFILIGLLIAMPWIPDRLPLLFTSTASWQAFEH